MSKKIDAEREAERYLEGLVARAEDITHGELYSGSDVRAGFRLGYELAKREADKRTGHQWEKSSNDLVMWVCKRCKVALAGVSPGYTRPASDSGPECREVPVEPTTREPLMDVTAHLAAALSLLKKGGHAGAAPSNKMFDQMLRDYQKSVDRARKILRGEA